MPRILRLKQSVQPPAMVDAAIDLSSLTREQKIELLDLLKEKKLRNAQNWQPRHYQENAWGKLLSGEKKLAILIWHRRAGKDDMCLQLARKKMEQRVGNYWHCLPEYAQARKAIWEAINPRTGLRRIDEAFPDRLCEVKRSQDMFIRFKNGSTWQLVGSDSYDRLVGSPPIGITVSEWALANPNMWAYLRPILLDNDGWAVFITTYRGKNHAYRMLRAHVNDPGWVAEVVTAKDSGTLTQEQLDEELLDYMNEFGEEDGRALFDQEYMCSPDAAIVGAYWAKMIRDAENEGRVTSVPYDPQSLVHTAWDLGMRDPTAIWMFQIVGREIRIINHLRGSWESLGDWVSQLNKNKYAWGTDYLPHDAGVKEMQTGMSRKQFLEGLGRVVEVMPNTRLADQIAAVRQILPRCWFDKAKCDFSGDAVKVFSGLDALRSYRREYNQELKIFNEKPLHDWASHDASAFQQIALAIGKMGGMNPRRTKYPKGAINPRTI